MQVFPAVDEFPAFLAELGVTEFIQGARYNDLDGFQRSFDPLTERIEAYRAQVESS